MKKIIIPILFSVIVFLSACKGKEACEVNHTGNIKITNVATVAIDVYINGTKFRTLEALEDIVITRPLGKYNVKVVNSTFHKEYEVEVKQCETTAIAANVYSYE
jgi:hypothetical protein